MKKLKNLFGTIVFLGIGIFLFTKVSYMFRPLDDNFFRRVVTGFYAEEEDSLDIVGIGASTLYFYLNNPVLWENHQWTSYNLSTAGQSNFMIEGILDEIKKTQDPQLYIIEVRMFLNRDKKEDLTHRFNNMLDNLTYSANRYKLINHMVDDWDKRFQYYFDIGSYHDSWEDFTVENLKFADNVEKNPTKGWKNRKRIKKLKLPKLMPKEEVEPMPISPECEEALVSLLEKCKRENLPVLFLATPWKTTEEIQSKSKYLAEMIEEAGYPYLDCNYYYDEIGIKGSQDFFDRVHANMLGSEKVTTFVGQYIEENFQLSSDHPKELIEEWDALVVANKAEADAIRAEMLKTKGK